MSESPEIRWFEQFPKCARCGKDAQGILRGTQNQSFGNHCQRCANARLKASERERAANAKAEGRS